MCERNHGVTDIMMEKIKEGDPTIGDQEALDYALHAKNMQTSRKGFSPFQVVYGSNPRIPGIHNGNLTGLNDKFISSDVKTHLRRIHLAREAFLQADSDDRLKRALQSRIPRNHDHFYYVGDSVFFKEEGTTEWSGPAKVLSVDGKVVFLRYGNRLRRVHITRLALNEREDTKNYSSNENTNNSERKEVDNTNEDNNLEQEKDEEKKTFTEPHEQDNDSPAKRIETDTDIENESDNNPETFSKKEKDSKGFKRKSSRMRPEEHRKSNLSL